MVSLAKSVFISVFIAMAVYGAILGGLILSERFSLDNLGLAITSFTIVIFFVGLYAFSQARTSEGLSVYTIAIIIGFLLGVIPPAFMPNFNLNGVALNVVLTIGWILYIKWYSVFEDRDSTILNVGKKLPDFVLENTSKEKISSSTFIGSPTIYLFYRGNWCPLCMAQIKEIAGQYKELESRGVNMVFVSPQPHFYSERLSKRYDLGFHYLQDTDNEVAKQLGIFAENGIPAGFQVLGFDSDTLMPTVVITDKKGRIVFADLTDNYRIRPEPETFLAIIDGM